MTQRPFGWTGVQVPVIGQGTWMIEGSAEAERRAGSGFGLKAYHDKVLSYGSAPARHVRALMFDEPIG